MHRTKPDGLGQAVAWFQLAVDKDPRYPLAHASLAHAYALLAMVPFDVLPPHEAVPKANAAARKALELDERLPEAHAAHAVVRHHYYRHWLSAETAYRRALQLNPHTPGA